MSTEKYEHIVTEFFTSKIDRSFYTAKILKSVKKNDVCTVKHHIELIIPFDNFDISKFAEKYYNMDNIIENINILLVKSNTKVKYDSYYNHTYKYKEIIYHMEFKYNTNNYDDYEIIADLLIDTINEKNENNDISIYNYDISIY